MLATFMVSSALCFQAGAEPNKNNKGTTTFGRFQKGVSAATARIKGGVSLLSDKKQCKDNPEMILRALAGYYKSYTPGMLSAPLLKGCFSEFLLSADHYVKRPNSRTAKFNKDFLDLGVPFLKKAVGFFLNPPKKTARNESLEANATKEFILYIMSYDQESGHYKVRNHEKLKNILEDYKKCPTVNVDKLARVTAIYEGKGAELTPVILNQEGVLSLNAKKPLLWLHPDKSLGAKIGDIYQISRTLNSYYDKKQMVLVKSLLNGLCLVKLD